MFYTSIHDSHHEKIRQPLNNQIKYMQNQKADIQAKTNLDTISPLSQLLANMHKLLLFPRQPRGDLMRMQKPRCVTQLSVPLLPTHSLTALTICTLIILLAAPPSLALCLTQCSNLVGDNSVGNKSILSHHHHHPRQFPDFPCFHAPEFSSIVSETSLAIEICSASLRRSQSPPNRVIKI